MSAKRLGKQSYRLPSGPYLIGNAAIVGKKEGEGPLSAHFDQIIPDELYGQDTFEQAERQFYQNSIQLCLQKANLSPDEVQFLLGGDLLNQITSASFAARELGIPFLGLYGACSTMAESLCIGGMLLDGGYADNAVCVASSHFCTAERQYRFPLEFGSQRTPTAQWTVTGAGASLLSLQPSAAPLARLRQITVGRVIDLGVSDANNMGAAMAPVGVNIGPSQLRGGLWSTVAGWVEVILGPWDGSASARMGLKRRGRNKKNSPTGPAAWDGWNLYKVVDVRRNFEEKRRVG